MNLKRRHFAFIFLVIFFFQNQVFAQRNYADVAPSFSSQWFVSNPSFASDTDKTNAAGIDFGWLQLKFSTTKNGGITTFIRLDIPGLDYNNYGMVGIEAYNNASATTNGNKLNGGFSTYVVKNGSEIYLAVTPCENYNSIRISYYSLTNTARVYYGFTGFDTNECNAPWAIPAKPTSTQNSFAYCEDEDPTVTASISNPICGLIYTWYDGGTKVQTGTNSSYIMPLNSTVGIHNLTVAASRPECGVESVKEAIIVIVNPKPVTLNIQSIN